MRLAILSLVLLPIACATVGGPGLGDVDLPSSGVGPFRKLTSSEVQTTAPFLLDDPLLRWRDPGVLPLGGTEVALYAVVDRDVAGEKREVIVRSRATDGRTFFGGRGGQVPPIAVIADAPWEGRVVSGPSPVRIGGDIWLYYAADGGIGRARSSDGIAFTKEPAPVLANDATHVFHAPSVVVFPDGRVHLFASAGNAFYEVVGDGKSFSPPALVLDAATVATEAGVVVESIEDPLALVRVTAAGRTHVRVLYTSTVTGPTVGATSAIALAARYGDDGVLSRAQTGPVFSATETQRSPAVAELGDYSLLYVVDVRRNTTHPSLVGAVGPATVTLPPPDEYPGSP